MEEYRLSGEAMLQRANIREACSLIAKAFDTMSQVGGNEARVFEGLNNTSLVLEHVRYVHVAEPSQEAPVKCLECGGKGFIEHNAGLLQVKCTACHGTGQIADGDVLKAPESTTVFDQESQNVLIVQPWGIGVADGLHHDLFGDLPRLQNRGGSLHPYLPSHSSARTKLSCVTPYHLRIQPPLMAG